MLYTELGKTVKDAGRLKKKERKAGQEKISSSKEGADSVDRCVEDWAVSLWRRKQIWQS